MQFSVDDVRAVARLLKEHNLAEISIETTSAAQPARLAVRRATNPPLAASGTAPPLSTTAAPTATVSILDSNGDNSSATASAAGESSGEPEPVTIKSSAVGLFRNAEPAVQVGDRVRVGQVVGVVESLKVPNEVGALVHGAITEILVEEGQGVEYGQPLLVLRPETA